MKVKKIKKITIIGGGTGTYQVLTGLKKYPVGLSVIVSMMDSGGSNRIIRDEFGLLPTSDIRQCIVALSEEKPKDILRKLFTYRYSSGTGITGMTFGNLFMAALTDIYGSQEMAIAKTCEFLDVAGKVIPVTFDSTNLVALYDNGKQVLGEHAIDEPPEELSAHRIMELSVFPKAKANKAALNAIKDSDLIVLGPGDLYTSVLPNIVIAGIKEAVIKSRARKVYVMNLMTRWGQTNGFTASRFVHEVEKYLGKKSLDAVLINNAKLPAKAVKWYAATKSVPVKDDLGRSSKMDIIRRDFVDGKIRTKHSADKLTRSLVRHDSEKLAKAIIEILNA